MRSHWIRVDLIYKFIRNGQTVFQSVSAFLYSPPVGYEYSTFFTFLLSLFFKILAMIAIQSYLMVVLIYIPLMASDVDSLFIYLCAICTPSLVKYLFMSFAQFVTGLLVFSWLIFENFRIQILVLCLLCGLHTFYPSLLLVFLSSLMVLFERKVVNFGCNISNFLMQIMLLELILRTVWISLDPRNFLLNFFNKISSP